MVISASVLWLVIVSAQPPVQPDVADFRRGTVEERRQTMREVSRQAERGGGALLPLIDAGLRDEDRQVAFSASSALTMIVQRARGTTIDASQLRGEISEYPPLVTAIAGAMRHSDLRVRGGTVGAIRVLGPAQQKALLPQLVDFVTIETEPAVKAAGIAVLGDVAPKDPAALDTVLAALRDPAPVVRRGAALVVGKSAPPAALPLIAQELERGIVETRAEFVFALAAYGAAARPYVGLLERLLAIETREDRRRQIRGAIAAIQKP